MQIVGCLQFSSPAWRIAVRDTWIGWDDDLRARALDRLYEADRASLMTEVTIAVIHLFRLDLSRIHNDSTTVKACGHYSLQASGSGLCLENGHSEDHRPDLKPLVFNLSLCGDGAVPIYHKVYPGNRNDDTIHIETWQTLCEINGKRDFLGGYRHLRGPLFPRVS